eukprot:12890732-Prorocentrum_lima.AAC.1
MAGLMLCRFVRRLSEEPYTLTHSLTTHSLTHSPTHPLTHSLTHSLTRGLRRAHAKFSQGRKARTQALHAMHL